MTPLCRFDETDIYDGKVVGLFQPLRLEETVDRITVTGETFQYAISRQTGQMVSARVLDAEYIAEGTSLPDPYIGLFPEDDPGAKVTGDRRDARYGFEKASRIKPPMYSRDLTNSAMRCDARDSIGVRVRVAESGPCALRITAEGEYAESGRGTGVGWRITYAFDVDSFARVDVEAIPKKPVLLQWHCFLHTHVARRPCEFLVPWMDRAMAGILGFGLMPPQFLEGRKAGELLHGAEVNPYLHFGNRRTGIEFTKERFDQRMTGYRDAGATLDGVTNSFDTAQAPDGTWVWGADSRGRRRHMTQVYLRDEAVEVEDFDVRNTTCPLNPGDRRHQYFFIQLTPGKQPREDLNSVRVAWPGPHQIAMAGWNLKQEWAPPGDEQIAEWKAMRVNLLIGGANYFDGDTPSLVQAEKVRAFLRKAHEAGMKVIPYVTFSDFEFGARDYRAHAADWYSSHCIEFKNETLLMCPGADDWRDHVEKQLEWLLSNFEFDGIYVDQWQLRACDNPRHGCGLTPFRFVTDGYHDFAKRARRVVARHTHGKGVMLMNGGSGVASCCASMFDLGLMGENTDMRKVANRELLSTMNPERTGSHALVYPSGFGQNNAFFNFAAAAGFSFNARFDAATAAGKEPDDDKGRTLGTALWKIYADFDLNRARRISTFQRTGILDIEGKGAQINAYCRDGRVLLLGGRLASARTPEIDADALAADIRGAVLRAGFVNWVADDLVYYMKPFFKPADATASIDDLEAAKRQAFSEGAHRKAGDGEVSERVRVTLVDPAALGMKAGPTYRLTDLLGRARPSPLRDDAFTVDLIDNYPFAILVEPG